VKAAGVVVDDTAVTPAYVKGLAAERELPIIRRIATGSLRNKLLFILPAALLLSAIAPTVVEILLMFGGAFLCYEGAHKVIHAVRKDEHHDTPAVEQGPEAESRVVRGAIRTDFILSAEIMVIALKEVLEEPLVSRAVILVVVAVAITIAVYGVVALIVKMDDVGLALAQRGSETSRRTGLLLVAGMPRLLKWLSIIGTAAMLWVGGHLLLAGADELGWGGPEALVHALSDPAGGVGVVGGLLAWLIATAAAAVVGLAVGAAIVALVAVVPRPRRRRERDGSAHDEGKPADHPAAGTDLQDVPARGEGRAAEEQAHP
jgi:hypothetical protein